MDASAAEEKDDCHGIAISRGRHAESAQGVCTANEHVLSDGSHGYRYILVYHERHVFSGFSCAMI